MSNNKPQSLNKSDKIENKPAYEKIKPEKEKKNDVLKPEDKLEVGSDEWVSKYTELLKQKLPKHLQKQPFLPDNMFYAQYFVSCLQNRTGGAHYMANTLFKYLGIDPQGCIIDFFNEADYVGKLGKDTAGFYTETVKYPFFCAVSLNVSA